MNVEKKVKMRRERKSKITDLENIHDFPQKSKNKPLILC